jgi:glycosyltransferase involved in cell wall biosynthesis
MEYGPRAAHDLPLVSVITPTHNRADLLRHTAISILDQSYPLIEYIVVDDGSTDHTQAIIRSLPPRPGRSIRYARQDCAGEAEAVNLGWRLATGDLVAVVSSDDPQPPNWLSVCVPLMQAHPAAIVGYPNWRIIGAEGEELARVEMPEFNRETLIGDLVCLAGPGTLIRRSRVPWDALRREIFDMCSDFDCWLRLALLGDFVHIPYCVANWREHAAGKSGQARSGLLWYREMKQVLGEFFAETGLPEEVRRLRWRAWGSLHYQGARKLWRHRPLFASWLLLVGFVLLAPAGCFPARHFMQGLLQNARAGSP